MTIRAARCRASTALPPGRISLPARLAPLALLLGAAAAPGHAQVAWTPRTSPVQPTARTAHGMAYDEARARVVLFGGCDNVQCFGDTWTWNNLTWQPVAAPGPAARYGHAMVYDAARQRIVLFGGGTGSQDLFGDTWEFDGLQWTRVATTGPGPRWNISMAYDPVRSRVVLFGGSTPRVVFDDTWEWDGTRWTRRFPANSPSPRVSPALAYDHLRQRVLLFGGLEFLPSTRFFKNDTWEWDGQNWVQLTPTGPMPPPGRYAHSMAWDSLRERMVMFGGTLDLPPFTGPYFSDTWEWFGGQWVQRFTGPRPLGRAWAPLVYESRLSRVMTFGGNNVTTRFNDTWEYAPTQPGQTRTGGYGCPLGATALTLTAAAGELPWIGEPFTVELTNLQAGSPALIALGTSTTQWGGVPLPFPLFQAGFARCFLYVSLDALIPVQNPAGTASLALPIPNDPTLLGVMFFSQGFAADSSSPSGFAVSNALRATVGGK